MFVRLTFYKKSPMILSLSIPGWSNGRTPGFGPGSRGSNPCPGTKEKTPMYVGVFSLVQKPLGFSLFFSFPQNTWCSNANVRERAQQERVLCLCSFLNEASYVLFLIFTCE